MPDRLMSWALQGPLCGPIFRRLKGIGPLCGPYEGSMLRGDSGSVADREARQRLPGGLLLRMDPPDLAPHLPGNRLDEGRQLRRLPLGQDLDAPVFEVPDVARDVEAARDPLGREAEPDALDPPFEEDSPPLP